MVAVEIIELTQKSAEGHYFIFVHEESFKLRQWNWGLTVKIIKSEQLFLAVDKNQVKIQILPWLKSVANFP